MPTVAAGTDVRLFFSQPAFGIYYCVELGPITVRGVATTVLFSASWPSLSVYPFNFYDTTITHKPLHLSG